MADYVVLTRAQANAVRGPTAPGHALDPIELGDGTFVLPPAVLGDGAHAARHAALAGRPQRAVADVEWKWRAEPVVRSRVV